MKLFIFLVLSLLSNFSVYAVTPSQRDWNHLFSTLTIKPYKFPIELITGKTIPEAKVIAKASLLKYYNDRGEDYKKHMGVDYNPYTGSGLYEKIDKGLEQINTIEELTSPQTEQMVTAQTKSHVAIYSTSDFMVRLHTLFELEVEVAQLKKEVYALRNPKINQFLLMPSTIISFLTLLVSVVLITGQNKKRSK